jgi:ATPase subunit of ABC transporter with duplicated ATPase domains
LAQTIDRPSSTVEGTTPGPRGRRRWPLVVVLLVVVTLSATAAWAIPQAGGSHRFAQSAAEEHAAIGQQRAAVTQAQARLTAAQQQLAAAQAQEAVLGASRSRSARQIRALQAQITKLQADIAARAAASQRSQPSFTIPPPVIMFCYKVFNLRLMKWITICEKHTG